MDGRWDSIAAGSQANCTDKGKTGKGKGSWSKGGGKEGGKSGKSGSKSSGKKEKGAALLCHNCGKAGHFAKEVGFPNVFSRLQQMMEVMPRGLHRLPRHRARAYRVRRQLAHEGWCQACVLGHAHGLGHHGDL